MCTTLWQRKWAQSLWQRKRAQRCDSDGADSNVTALTVTALGHQWLWHRCDSDIYISVTAMTADSAVTAVKTDSAVTAVAADSAVREMCTLVWQRCQLPLLSQWCAHRCHTNVHIAVTLIWTSLSHRCQLTALSQRCQCHRCHSAVSCHCCHTSVHSSVTAFSLSPLLHRCQFTSMTH